MDHDSVVLGGVGLLLSALGLGGAGLFSDLDWSAGLVTGGFDWREADLWLTWVLESPPPPPPRRYFKFKTSLRVSSQPPIHPTNSRGIPGGRLPLLNLNFSLETNWERYKAYLVSFWLTLFQQMLYSYRKGTSVLFLTCWQDVGDKLDRCCHPCWPPVPCLETILLPYSSGSPCMTETSYKSQAVWQQRK